MTDRAARTRVMRLAHRLLLGVLAGAPLYARADAGSLELWATVLPATQTLSATLALDPPGGGVVGMPLTASLSLFNAGAKSVVARVEYDATGPAVFGPASPPSPRPVVNVPAGGSRLVQWTYTPTACGAGSVDVALTWTDSGSSSLLGPETLSVLTRITGPAALIVGAASPTRVPAGRSSNLVFTVEDSCGTGLPGLSVTLFVVTGPGTVTPAACTTDATGRIAATLSTGRLPGLNGVRAEAAGVPGTTVTVDGTAPDREGMYLSRNAFNPGRREHVQIRITMPTPERVRCRIYTISGELVRQLGDTDVPAGQATWDWDACNDAHHQVADGVYFIQLTCGTATTLRRVLVLRN